MQDPDTQNQLESSSEQDAGKSSENQGVVTHDAQDNQKAAGHEETRLNEQQISSTVVNVDNAEPTKRKREESEPSEEQTRKRPKTDDGAPPAQSSGVVGHAEGENMLVRESNMAEPESNPSSEQQTHSLQEMPTTGEAHTQVRIPGAVEQQPVISIMPPQDHTGLNTPRQGLQDAETMISMSLTPQITQMLAQRWSSSQFGSQPGSRMNSRPPSRAPSPVPPQGARRLQSVSAAPNMINNPSFFPTPAALLPSKQQGLGVPAVPPRYSLPHPQQALQAQSQLLQRQHQPQPRQPGHANTQISSVPHPFMPPPPFRPGETFIPHPSYFMAQSNAFLPNPTPKSIGTNGFHPHIQPPFPVKREGVPPSGLPMSASPSPSSHSGSPHVLKNAAPLSRHSSKAIESAADAILELFQGGYTRFDAERTARVAWLEDEVTRLQERTVHQTTHISRLKAVGIEKLALEQTNKRLVDENADLHAKLLAQQQVSSSASAKLTMLKGRAEKIARQMEAKDARIAELEGAFKERTEQLQVKDTRIAELDSAAKQRSEQLQARDARIAELERTAKEPTEQVQVMDKLERAAGERAEQPQAERIQATQNYGLTTAEFNDLIAKPEPQRCHEWMRLMFVPKSGSEVTQLDFWNLYKDLFSKNVEPGSLLVASEVLKNITNVFPQAKAIVLPGPSPRFVVRGVDRRKMSTANV